MLPTFLVIGAQKAATTSVWAYLRQHDDVFLPELKETNYFLREGNLGRGLPWYEGLFAGARDDQARGEVSPGYTMWPFFAGAPERIAALVPDVKLVYLVREPVARLVSGWRQAYANRLELRPLAECALTDLRYIAPSQYATQIECFLEHFDRSQLLVVRSEDLAAAPQDTMARICRFIDVDPSRLSADLGSRHNLGDDKLVPRRRVTEVERVLPDVVRRPFLQRVTGRRSSLWYRELRPDEQVLDPGVVRELVAYLRHDLERLVELCGPDFDAWGLLPGRV